MFDKIKEKINESKKYSSFNTFPDLVKIKPREGYVFHSDYFKLDDSFACILSFRNIKGAEDKFSPFWGIDLIPMGLDKRISTINFEQIQRMGESWVQDKQKTAETVSNMNTQSQDATGSTQTKVKARRELDDLQTVIEELTNGASYLTVKDKMLVIAPTLDLLEKSIMIIETYYNNNLGTVIAAPYQGEQRQELTNLFASNEQKRGKGWHFTSTEYAGKYNLVTHGMEDAAGEYVGFMYGDVNNSAVLFDIDGYDDHIVVASDTYVNYENRRIHLSDVWASKISQSTLISGKRVVHLILNDCNLDYLGGPMESITAKLDMNKGEINMFEMFGNEEDELQIFAAQMEKLKLMTEQLYETTVRDRSIVRGVLDDIVVDFYQGFGMWSKNAKKNRDKIRILGIPHEDIPTLRRFNMYLTERVKEMEVSEARNENRQHAVDVLENTFKSLINTNGDLFDRTTSNKVDDIAKSKRVIYDFANLSKRGKEIVTAQFLNVLSFAIGNLSQGDTLIIHGAEEIDPRIYDYVERQTQMLKSRGGRVCYIYNNIEKAFNTVEFNRFDKADYTIFGNMTNALMSRYEEILKLTVPNDLKRLITLRGRVLSYVRRGFQNVVFTPDIKL